MTDHSETIAQLRETVKRVCDEFPGEYWRAKDRERQYPTEFVHALTELGLLAALIPEEYGGSGLPLSVGGEILKAIHEFGANAGACHAQMYTMGTVLRHGNAEQKAQYLPAVARGELRLQAFGVTEPTAGTDTTSISTFAMRKGDRYVVNGQKIWTSRAEQSDLMVLLARTTPKDQVKRKTEGLSLFYTDLDRRYVEVREIPKMGRKAVDSNAVFYDGLPVPKEDLIGEEGKGFHYILHGLNPERILIAAEAVGLGRAALNRAVNYAKERVVFGRPIGQNQGIAHPLAKCWVELEAAELLAYKAAFLYDAKLECGAQANAAKYLCAEAGFHACETAVLTHGGMGYAKEYHVERYLREVMIPRIAPVSREMILNFIAEKVLGLPRSF